MWYDLSGITDNYEFFGEEFNLATKKTSTVKKTAASAAKKAVKSAATKVVEATVATAAVKATKAVKKAVEPKCVYVFFNCDGEKDAGSMNPRYNNEAFADSTAGRKALLKKVEEEVAAGRVHVVDIKEVEKDILKGDPTEAASKLQYGDIERMTFVA